MNYQNNIDAYYAYAKENHKRRQKEERATWLWLIGSIIVLLGVWAYFSNLNLLNVLGSKDENSKSNLSKVVLADDTSRKNSDEVSKTINVTKSDEVNNKDSASKNIEMNKKTEKRGEHEKTPFDLASKKDINMTKESKASLANVSKNSVPKSQEQVKMVAVAIVNNGNDANSSVKESIAMGLTKKADINSSLKVEGNSSIALVENRDINSSLKESTSKLGVVTTVEQNGSIDLYHIYIVSKGESIYDIARKEYGDTQMYVKIVNANQDLENPNKIREGQELFLPIINESKSYSDILHFK